MDFLLLNCPTDTMIVIVVFHNYYLTQYTLVFSFPMLKQGSEKEKSKSELPGIQDTVRY